MRFNRAAAILVSCLSAAAAISFAFAATAAAEWTEVGRPCNLGPGAILPQPVLWFPVGQVVDTPRGYFTYGPESGEHSPPASDFTAVANWGDGVTTPASVEAGGASNCYGVSAPSHAYANAGAYLFSYTVHDLQTGLDHTLAATELHAWSVVPTLIASAPARSIEAQVGTPWSGTVAEFHYEAPSGNPSLYRAQIEWGGAAPASAGTIAELSPNTFAVSGTTTYPEPFHGSVSVLLSDLSEPLGTWTTATVTTVSPRVAITPAKSSLLRGPAIFAALPKRRGATVYEIAFRTAQTLPQQSSGRVLASIELHGKTSPVHRLIPAARSKCYLASVRDRGLKPGVSYAFTLSVKAAKPTQQGGHAVLRRFADTARLRSVLRRQLGCH